MSSFYLSTLSSLSLFTLFSLIIVGCDNSAARRAAVERTQAQVQKIADELDKKTTDTGVYIRAKEGDIKERDPWGTPLQVSYSQGGVAEELTVRSSGPDRQIHTSDDILASRMATNFKGVGEGIKRNVEETAANAAKGLVKGTVEGIKDTVADAFRSNKKKTEDKVTEAEPAKRPAQHDADK